MIEEIKKFIDYYKIFNKGDRLLLGLSAGPDSMALLSIILKLNEFYCFEKIVIAHVDYGLRENSKVEALHVEYMARKYCIDFYLKKVKEKVIGNMEEWARNIRYSFFKEVMEKENLNKLVVAHNFDDLVETFLMRFLRGSFLFSLYSILPVNNNLVRPLLFVRKGELENYCRDNNLKYFIDESNYDLSYKRNFLRHEVISKFNEIKNWEKPVKKFFINTWDWVYKVVEKIESKIKIFENNLFLILDFDDVCVELEEKLLYLKLKYGFKFTFGIIEQLKEDKSKEFIIDKKLIKFSGNKIFILKNIDFTLPNLIYVNKKRDLLKILKFFNIKLNYEDIKFPVKIFFRKKGMRIGSKKIKKWFIDRKVEKITRDYIPILETNDKKVLILGWELFVR